MSPSKDHKSYKDYVQLRARLSPCINGLERYLQQPSTRSSNVVYIDYPARQSSPEIQPIRAEHDKITNLIDTLPPATTRLILIEDISPQLTSLLGNALEIDPIFFADYVNTTFENIELVPPPPSLAILPSLLTQRGYLHLHYQQVLDLGEAEIFKSAAYALKTDANITRNIRRLVPLSGKQLALARATCSLFTKLFRNSSICTYLATMFAFQANVTRSHFGRSPYKMCYSRARNINPEKLSCPAPAWWFRRCRVTTHKSDFRPSLEQRLNAGQFGTLFPASKTRRPQ